MSPSPSFNSFSNNNLAAIATRVVQEFTAGDAVFAAVGGEFEFASQTPSAVSADEIFRNGKILPVYPAVNRNPGTPLRKLLAEEREVSTATSSSSSSDVDELDGVPAETYCVWRPKASGERRWKRSSSSKKWKLKDFLPRSFSVGSKRSLVHSSPGNRGRSKEEEKTIKESPVGREEVLLFLSPSKKVGSDLKGPPSAAAKSPPPPYSRDIGEKRRSYLPYGQHQVGFFAFMNGLGKNLQPF